MKLTYSRVLPIQHGIHYSFVGGCSAFERLTPTLIPFFFSHPVYFWLENKTKPNQQTEIKPWRICVILCVTLAVSEPLAGPSLFTLQPNQWSWECLIFCKQTQVDCACMPKYRFSCSQSAEMWLYFTHKTNIRLNIKVSIFLLSKQKKVAKRLLIQSLINHSQNE